MKKPTTQVPLSIGRGVRGEAEHHLQTQSVAWFGWQYPTLADLLFAIPNGGKRSKATAGKLKAEGVRAGVADLFLSVARQGCHGLYIEMKTATGAQRTSQRRFQQRVTTEGYAYVIARSLEEFQRHVHAYLATPPLPSLGAAPAYQIA